MIWAVVILSVMLVAAGFALFSKRGGIMTIELDEETAKRLDALYTKLEAEEIERAKAEKEMVGELSDAALGDRLNRRGH